ncbi:MAB_1171c family putative transporter [Kutzneria sp. NPDC052558]|uniref:MAB_1171c family putative transporter n=1 Tax=Kutzneria sp. NPDC052558 TaxID=3364121 RepID=UPI0037C6FB56
MLTFALVATVVVAAVALTTRLRMLVRVTVDRRPGHVLALGFAAWLLAVPLEIESIAVAVDQWAGWALSWPLLRVIACAGGFFTQTFYRLATTDRADPAERARITRLVRGSALFGVTALAVGVILFATMPQDVLFASGPTGRMITPGPVHPVAALANLIILCYFAYTIGSITFASWRWAAKADLPWLRRGLRVHTVGCVFGIAYCVHVAAYQLTEVAGIFPPWKELEGDGALVAMCLLPAFVGVTAPMWGPRLDGLVRAVRHYRHRRALYPLWLRLSGSIVRLDPPRTEWHDRLRLRPGQQHALVYRRVIELWDGLLAEHPAMVGGGGLDGPDLARDIHWWLEIARAAEVRPIDDVLAEYQGHL